MVLLRLGKDEDALWEFREVVRVDPRFARAHFGLGMTLARRAKLDEAIGEYDEAIRLDPKEAVAFVNRGLAFAGKKDFDRAIQDYDQAIKLNPNHTRAIENRAKAIEAKTRVTPDQGKAIAPTNSISLLSYSGWNKVCDDPKPGEKPFCAIAVEAKQNGNTVATLGYAQASNNRWLRVLFYGVPLDESRGLIIKIDGSESRQALPAVKMRNCVGGDPRARTCFADMDIFDDAFAMLKSGKVVRVEAFGQQGETITLAFPLSGFAGAVATFAPN